MAHILYYPNSSNLSLVNWSDEAEKSLTVSFKTGSIYHSKGSVPKSVIVEWIAAESAGKFYHSRIKGVYELEKVPDGNDELRTQTKDKAASDEAAARNSGSAV